MKRISSLNNDNRTLLANLIGTYLVKGLAIVISVFMTPAYIRYFEDNAVLGAWFAIVSILNWIITFDFGIGNGLRNKLISAIHDKDEESKKGYVSSAYYSVGIIAIITGVICISIINGVDLNRFFGISYVSVSPLLLRKTVKIVLVGVLLHFVLQLISSILYAMQKTAVPNALALCSSFILLIYVLFVQIDTMPAKLESLAWAQVISVNVPLFIASLMAFGKKMSSLRPRFSYFHMNYAKQVISLGGYFFIIQIALLIVNSTNEMLISSRYTSDNVVDYQIYSKIYFLVVSLFALLTQPTWSAVAKASSEKNYRRIQKLYKLVLTMASIGTLGVVLITLSFQWIVDLWLKNDSIMIDKKILLVFSILVIEQLYISASTAVANGLGRLRCQLVFTLFAAMIKYPLVLILSSQTNSWAVVVLSNALSIMPLLVFVTIDLNLFLWRENSQRKDTEKRS